LGFGFGLNGIWKSEEDLRLLFVFFVLFYSVWKALGQRGSVDYGFGPVASLVFGAGRLGHVAGGLRPPLASPAPTSLACPHQPRLPLSASPAPMARRRARHWYSALGSGFGSRHWVFLLSLLYISSLFSFSLDQQTIHHLLVSTARSVFIYMTDSQSLSAIAPSSAS